MNIVLAHGILGFEQKCGIGYFNQVAAHLRQQSLRVLPTEVSPVRGIEQDRGPALQRQIQAAFADGRLDPSQKAHLIAHSLGGLDARFILSPDNAQNLAARIASLTTIGTPHQGSPVADLLFASVDGESPFGAAAGGLERLLRSIVEKLGISLDGLHDLTTAATAEFNRAFRDHPQVRYFSVAGAGRGGFLPTCGLLVPVHAALKSLVGANDGLVAVQSASRWAGTRLWPADHADEVGHDLNRGLQSPPTHFDHLAAYDQLVARLAEM